MERGDDLHQSHASEDSWEGVDQGTDSAGLIGSGSLSQARKSASAHKASMSLIPEHEELDGEHHIEPDHVIQRKYLPSVI